MGYEASVTTKRRGDFGIDVIAKKDNDIVAIQVKQNSEGNNVGNRVVQQVLGAMRKFHANKAIIVTTAEFTVEAKEQAEGAPIELWDKLSLHKMVRKYFIDKPK